MIRPATANDAPAMAEIYSHYVLTSCATFELEPPSAGELTHRLEHVQSLGLPWLVAELDDGAIAGYAYANHYRPREAYRFTVEDSVYIRPSHTGQGLGRALVERLMEQCRVAGARQMVAVIGDSANVASVRLHARLGFRHVGVLEQVGFKHGRWVDTVLMQRLLIDQR